MKKLIAGICFVVLLPVLLVSTALALPFMGIIRRNERDIR